MGGSAPVCLPQLHSYRMRAECPCQVKILVLLMDLQMLHRGSTLMWRDSQQPHPFLSDAPAGNTATQTLVCRHTTTQDLPKVTQKRGALDT